MSAYKSRLEQLARRAANSMGFEIARRHHSQGFAARRQMMLDSAGVNAVLDIGANMGQFATELRFHGFQGLIVSVEPIDECAQVLRRQAGSRTDWKIVQAAVGVGAPRQQLNVSKNLQSSSLLPMREIHTSSAPGSSYVRQEAVEVLAGADVVERHLPEGRIMAKLDTQGTELDVLRSLGPVLARIPMLQLELSLVELYEGQSLIEELIEFCRHSGYAPVLMEQNDWNTNTLDVLQVDCVFRRGGR